MPLKPVLLLQRLCETLLLDVEKLVKGPRRPLVLRDHQVAERECLLPVRMIDASARLTIHAGNWAVLVFVFGDDVRRTMSRVSSSPVSSMTTPQHIEDLPLAERMPAASLGDGVVEMFEHDFLLIFSVPCVWTVRLAHDLLNGDPDFVEKRFEVRLLAVACDRHVRSRDVETDGKVFVLRRLRDRVARPHPKMSMSRLSRDAEISPATGVRLTKTASRMSS